MEDTEDCKMDRNRFQQIYSQGKLNVMEIWVDKETGVNYLFHYSGQRSRIYPFA